MALVVTLIMLSVITFMAITFLVLSRSEHGAVATETDQTQARLAAETGLQRAIAEALAPMLAQTNEFQYGLMVSTNYINPLGFTPGVVNPANVNYDYKVGGSKTFTSQEWAQNIANLWFDPRPPLFITNRSSILGGYEFRFFLNLNRNTNLAGPLFDPTGWLAVTNNGVIVGSNWFVGDPQWIGILSSPDRPHAPDNRFVARYAFLALPANKTLDLNYVYNYAKSLSPAMAASSGDGFLRNEGVGTWEDNLASFLVDLNTNIWLSSANPYTYMWQPQPVNAYLLPNRGAAFDDAFSILRYRYGGNLANLASVSALFGNSGAGAFGSDFFDGYSAGPPALVLGNYFPDPDLTKTSLPWSGAYNLNHFFTDQELFDPNKTSPNFVQGLLAKGSDTNSSYNLYTFYRLLSQLGTDSAPEKGRMNLNYDNLARKNPLGIASATNFYNWGAIDFFTNAANRLLANAGYNFTVTNIQIFPTNFYTPSVHRFLQLAANIYDATTNRVFGNQSNLPSVFRPIFRQTSDGRVLIAGYQEVLNDSLAHFEAGGVSPPAYVLGISQNKLPSYGDSPPGVEPLVAGIPLVIGARKGLPNLNEFALQTQVFLQRKLQFRRAAGQNSGPIVQTNVLYILGISNTCGVEAWNSYVSAYPRGVEMHLSAGDITFMRDDANTVLLSNFFGGSLPATSSQTPPTFTSWPGIPATSQTGYGGNSSFKAWETNIMVLTNSGYANGRLFSPPGYVATTGLPTPHWFLTLRPQVRCALVDTATRRIIDYVSLDYPQTNVDLAMMAMTNASDYQLCAQCVGAPYRIAAYNPQSMWCTNRDAANQYVPWGILNQIDYNTQYPSPTDGQEGLTSSQVTKFKNQLFFGGMGTGNGPDSSEIFEPPYQPSRTLYFYSSWQANDPLVHYTIPDLTDAQSKHGPIDIDVKVNSPYGTQGDFGGLDVVTGRSIGSATPLNNHYRPWGGHPNSGNLTKVPEPIPNLPTNWRLEIKDPLVTRPDSWDFPIGKLPNVGWLGRVHRGTPWQTLYLKQPGIDLATWTNWTGDSQLVVNWNGQRQITNDAVFSLPVQDRYIVDLFTTAFNDNAGIGEMSVNQDGLAAWSAILGGVVVLTNIASDATLGSVAGTAQFDGRVVDPAGIYDPINTNAWPALVRILNGINMTRATNFSRGVFTRLGDVLAAPELTVASPFLNPGSRMDPATATTAYPRGRYTLQYSRGINDEAYERIPQQILGLLRADSTPRFVIYAYGQTLKPAPRSIITSGPFFQLCTNYQITAEVVTRAVVRVDGAPTHPHAVIESFNVLPPD